MIMRAMHIRAGHGAGRASAISTSPPSSIALYFASPQ